MTENEAIETLKLLRIFTNSSNARVQAIDIAISALTKSNNKVMEKRMKYFRYYWRDENRCETTAGIIIAATLEDAKNVAQMHLKIDKNNIIINEIEFSQDGFCEIYYE